MIRLASGFFDAGDCGDEPFMRIPAMLIERSDGSE
jgi:hypothetical protein